MKKTLILLAVASVAAITHADTYGPGAGGPLPDSVASVPGVFTSTINVGADITNVNSITLTDLSHTWAGDLNITVSNGLGSVDLVRRLGSFTTAGVGDSSNFLGTYTFAVGGASLLTEAGLGLSTYNMTPGTYAPSTNTFDTVSAVSSHVFTNYSALTGAGSSGLWTLTITDNAGGDTGALGSWSIDADPVPEPATMTVLALAALAAARRRKQK